MKANGNRIEDPEINPHSYRHLIFDKGPKNTHWRKDSLFHNWCWKDWFSTCRRLNLNTYFSTCTKINAKENKDLNVRSENLKLLQENTEKTLEDSGIGNCFLYRIPTAQEIKARIDKWDWIKLKGFCKWNNYQNQETIFTSFQQIKE
jgi:hypothetical protein